VPPHVAAAAAPGKSGLTGVVVGVVIVAKRGLGARVVPNAAVARETIASLDVDGVAMACVVYVEIRGHPAHLRLLLRRLRALRRFGARGCAGGRDGDDVIAVSTISITQQKAPQNSRGFLTEGCGGQCATTPSPFTSISTRRFGARHAISAFNAFWLQTTPGTGCVLPMPSVSILSRGTPRLTR